MAGRWQVGLVIGAIAAHYADAAPASGFLGAALATSPYVLWMLEETAGPAATDSSGNARHATYAGSPTFGQATLIAGRPRSTMMTASAQVDGPTGHTYASPLFSVGAWLTLNEQWLDFAAILGGTGTGGFQIHTDNGGRFYFTSTGVGSINTPVGYVDTTPRFYMFVQEPTALKAYVNGVEVRTAAATALASATQDIHLRFGVASQWGTRWRGRAQGFGYWKRPLSATEVAALYAAGI